MVDKLSVDKVVVDQVSLQLEDVNFWNEFIAENKRDGQQVHPKMKEKLLEAEERLMMSLLEKHSIDKYLVLNKTLH